MGKEELPLFTVVARYCPCLLLAGRAYSARWGRSLRLHHHRFVVYDEALGIGALRSAVYRHANVRIQHLSSEASE